MNCALLHNIVTIYVRKNTILSIFFASLFQHGESEYNVQKKLGGDSDLTVRGEEVS